MRTESTGQLTRMICIKDHCPYNKGEIATMSKERAGEFVKKFPENFEIYSPAGKMKSVPENKMVKEHENKSIDTRV